MPLGQFDEAVPVLSGISMNSATPINTDQTVVATLANRTRFDTLNIINTDSIAHNVAFYLVAGATRIHLGQVQAPIGAGTTTIVPLDALAQLMTATFHYLNLPAQVSLVCQIDVVIGATAEVDVWAMGGLV